jgi:hypothetical protein
MKQLLFLLLFPCLALAQYTGNGNQKITLGEQTSADGLVYRGNAADTVAATLKITKTNKSDTSAFLLLDTINNVFLKYNIGTTFWTRLNILPTDTVSMLGNYWRSGKFSGVLPVANGGTGQSTLAANKVMVGNGTSGVLTPTNLHWDNTNSRLGIGESSPSAGIHVVSTNTSLLALFNSNQANASFRIINSSANAGRTYSLGSGDNTSAGGNGLFVYDETGAALRLLINNTGNVGINTISPSEKLHVEGNARITAVGSTGGTNSPLYVTSTGVLSTNSSDVNKKHNVRSLPYGLNTINQLNPVAFDWNETDETDIGFIAQDIESIIPESVITNWDSQLIFKQEKIVPILVKAIQEQNALIKALEQRILILENK